MMPTGSDSETQLSSPRNCKTGSLPGSPPASPGPLARMAMLNTPPSSHANQQVPGAPSRRRLDNADTSSDSEDLLWDALRSRRRTGGPRSHSMSNLITPSFTPAPFLDEPGITGAAGAAGTAAPVVPAPVVPAPVVPAPAPAPPALGFKNVMILDIDGVSSSITSMIALDTFLFLVAWAPFSLYGALFFVIVQRVTLAMLERFVSKAVLR